MNTNLESHSSNKRPGSAPVRRVTDAPTRVFHALFGLMFALAYITAESEHWRSVHVASGYTFAALLGFRLLYSWAGPKSLSLGALGRKLALIPAWVRSLQNPFKVNWGQGQNLVMALMVATIMMAAVPLTLSGYALFNQLGPTGWLDLLEELHEFFSNLILLGVVSHLAIIVVMSVSRGQNMARPMWSGTVSGVGPDLVKANRVWLAVALLLCALVLVIHQWATNSLF